MEGSILHQTRSSSPPHLTHSPITNVNSALVQGMIVMIEMTRVVVEVIVVGVVEEEGVGVEEGMRVLGNLLTLDGQDDDRMVAERRDRLRRRALVDGKLYFSFNLLFPLPSVAPSPFSYRVMNNPCTIVCLLTTELDRCAWFDSKLWLWESIKLHRIQYMN